MKAKVKSVISVKKDDAGITITDVLSFDATGDYKLQKAIESELWSIGSNIALRLPEIKEKQFEVNLEIKTLDEY